LIFFIKKFTFLFKLRYCQQTETRKIYRNVEQSNIFSAIAKEVLRTEYVNFTNQVAWYIQVLNTLTQFLI